MMGRWAAWTLLVAMALGAAVALWYWPRWRTATALEQIVADDPITRRNGWLWLLGRNDSSSPPRADERLELILAALENGPDAALIDAGQSLRAIDTWTWDRMPAAIMFREATLLAMAGDPTSRDAAVEAIDICPLDLPLETLLPIVEPLLALDDASVRRRALDGLIAWAGRERVHQLADVALPDDEVMARRLELALAWSTTAPRPEPLATAAVTSPRVIEAHLLRRARHGASPAQLEPFAAQLGDRGPNIEAYALRHVDPAKAGPVLERLAETSEVAGFVRPIVAGEEQSRARTLAMNENESLERRRLGAWRWPDATQEIALSLLERDLAGESGAVCNAVLLADRHLSRERAAELADTWMHSFNDDGKRFGALLSALLSTHAEMLRKLYEAEDQAEVRLAQRAALFALGRRIGPEDDLELLYRALHRSDGRLNADVALGLALAGESLVLAELTALPAGEFTAEAIQSRSWLIERFVPQWHELAGRPIGGNTIVVRLHFDALDALRQLTSRRTRFDRSRPAFVIDESRSSSSDRFSM